MRLAIALFIVLLTAAPAQAETRYMVGLDASWDGRFVQPHIEIQGPGLAEDKLEHLLSGMAIAAVLHWAGWSPQLALAGAMGAGALKEARDTGVMPMLGHGDVEFGDFAWTAAGGAAYVGLSSLWP